MSMYGLDLRESLWGSKPLGVRRLLSLISGLPRESALTRAATDEWTQEDELLATVVDIIGVSNHMFLQANSTKGTRLPEPVHYPRPWEVTADAHVQSSKDEVRAFFTSDEFGTRLWDAHGSEDNLSGN